MCNGLLIKRADFTDIDTLNSICDSWEDYIQSEGKPFPPNYIKNCILYGDLPPLKEAKLNNYTLMTIVEDRQIIGFFDMYHGYPQKDCLWISIFVIAKNYRKKQYGQRVILSLTQLAAENGWKSCGVGISLKNWCALRFWTKNGFTRIGDIYGDREYSSDAFAIIRLYNDLNRITKNE